MNVSKRAASDEEARNRAPTRMSFGALGFDTLERVVIAAIYTRFAFSMLASFFERHDVATLLIAASEALPLLFILLRPPSSAMSLRPKDWVLGLLGTVVPFLVRPQQEAHSLLPVALCITLIASGFALQIAGKLALGARFGIVAANRGIVVTGPYRFLRHPIYAGYTLTHIGFLCAMPAWRTIALYTLCALLQLARILAEEQVLSQDQAYRDFAKRVRFRLLPGIF